MTTPITIRPFREADEARALELESRCIQGRALSLKFERPSFHHRSRLYPTSSILAAVLPDDRIVGLTAWAGKAASIGNDPVRAAVHYDLRVDPAYRGRGIAQMLMGAALEDADEHADCHYALAAGQNLPVARAVARFGRPHATWDLRFVCIPVRGRRGARPHVPIDPESARSAALRTHPASFRLHTKPEHLPGYVTSLGSADGNASASIWTTDSYLTERVVSMPAAWRAAGWASRHVHSLPRIPTPGDRLDAWFLYDVTATDASGAARLLRLANEIALERNRRLLCAIFPADDERIAHLSSAARLSYRLPYRLMVTGTRSPGPHDRLHIDPSDL